MDKSSYRRKDRLMQEREHDVYRSRAKLSDPTRCTECGVMYAKGRWIWAEAPEDATPTVCPACRRITDKFPAGQIEISGTFFAGHRDEIFNLVRNVEGKEKAEHPMERIMDIEELSDGARITTTGVHIARGIGAALSSAYSGETSVQYLADENYVKVSWTR